MPRLLLATGNRHKFKELKTLLAGIAYDIIFPADIGIDLEVDESGSSFEENAGLKAKAFAKRSGLLSLADDSGLEVNALGGEPGIYSARYAGEDATDAERVDYLLSSLKNVPEGKRQARFRCVIAIASPEGEVYLFNGECAGEISLSPRGKYGFGYDPVFYLPQLGKTMAELPPGVKNGISHRGRAAAEARSFLAKLAAEKHK
jgi:XTP/dITP diphosphohydrolase